MERALEADRSRPSPLVGGELQLQREDGAAGGCRHVVADEMGPGPDHLLTFSPFRVFCNIVAPPSFHIGTSVCLSSVQAAVSHSLPLWLLQAEEAAFLLVLRRARLHGCGFTLTLG